MSSPMDEQPRFDHRLGAYALRGQRVAQREALGRGVAEPEALLHRGAEAAIGEIAARSRADRRLQVGFEQARRHRPRRRAGSGASFLPPPPPGSPAASAGRPCRRAARPLPGSVRPSVSIRKAKASPCLPDEKSWKKPFWSLTKNEGVFSAVKGERPRHSRPSLRNLTRFPATSETGSRALISSRNSGGNFMGGRLALRWGFGKARSRVVPRLLQGRSSDRSAKRPRVKKGARNVGMGEVVAHEQKRFAPGLRVSIGETIAEVEIGLMTHDLAVAGGRLHRLACEIWRHRGLFRLERFAELDDRRQSRGDILARDGSLSPDPGSRQPERRLRTPSSVEPRMDRRDLSMLARPRALWAPRREPR